MQSLETGRAAIYELCARAQAAKRSWAYAQRQQTEACRM